jgi:hypothetical protein
MNRTRRRLGPLVCATLVVVALAALRPGLVPAQDALGRPERARTFT